MHRDANLKATYKHIPCPAHTEKRPSLRGTITRAMWYLYKKAKLAIYHIFYTQMAKSFQFGPVL